MEKPHRVRRFGACRLLAALAAAAAVALAFPEHAHSLEVIWQNIQEMDGHTTIQLLIWNDNPGTQYSEVRVNTLKPLLVGLGLDPSRDVTANLGSGTGYVDDGWLAVLGSEGIRISQDPDARESDPFGCGDVFTLTVRIDNAAYDYAAYRIALVTNAAGAADKCVYAEGYNGYATPLWVPGYLVSATGLAVRAACVEARGETNVVRLLVGTEGRRQFRVLAAGSPGSTNWAEALVCASTGVVTEVCETNTVPTRFYRVVSP